eukprot:CAMPEP_0203763898 /NCGR_PEP_ID=MMETSP0098-20131031/17068_1 /ASSEMBLY_ACC=CAM_ASM_000208 /TAXON_ID=96639 /ORGANISM=" , Strain NY0313808BC1" /LENGTH=362 /DNA_ID=CAMNT_0050659265 /DNA_START=803 /DNA_END=1891 /DNA_ORIENTATION=-
MSLFAGLIFSDRASAYKGKNQRELKLSEMFLRFCIELAPCKSRHAFVELSLMLEQNGNMYAARGVAQEVVRKTLAGTPVEDLTWTNPMQRPGCVFPGIRSQPYWSGHEFAWVKKLEESYESIKQELGLIADHWKTVGGTHREAGSEDGSVLEAGNWSEIVLYGRGANPSLCPSLSQLLQALVPEAIDLCARAAGEIIFSRLGPHTVIAPHCASTNLRLTAHLGIEIPASSKAQPCKIEVGGECKQWENGKVLLFDDSFEHSVVNETDKERTVLLLRFWHPDISLPERTKALERAISVRRDMFERRSMPPFRNGSNRAQRLYWEGCTTCNARCHEYVNMDMLSKKNTFVVSCPDCDRVESSPL